MRSSRPLYQIIKGAAASIGRAERTSFQENGFCKVGAVLSPKTIREIRSRFPLIFAGTFNTGIYPDEWHWREGISKEGAAREICNAWKADRIIANTVLCEELGALAVALTGWNSARVAQDDCIWKPPGSGAVGHHRDGKYISEQFVPLKNNSITVWIALDDADIDTGVIEYVPGSHKWSSTGSEHEHLNDFHGGVDDHQEPSRRAAKEAGIKNMEVKALSVPAGHAVIHHQDIWHGSGPNTSPDRIRRALVVHLIDGNVRFRTGESLSDDSISGPGYIYGRYKLLGTNVCFIFF